VVSPLKIFLATILGIGITNGAVFAQNSTLDKIKQSGTFTIGHRDASIPLSYLDDKQQPIGYSMEICGRIADAIKKELHCQS